MYWPKLTVIETADGVGLGRTISGAGALARVITGGVLAPPNRLTPLMVSKWWALSTSTSLITGSFESAKATAASSVPAVTITEALKTFADRLNIKASFDGQQRARPRKRVAVAVLTLSQAAR